MESFTVFILTLQLYLSSIIFIIAAYLLQRLSKMNNWNSGFLVTTKNILTSLSIITMVSAVFSYAIFRPF